MNTPKPPSVALQAFLDNVFGRQDRKSVGISILESSSLNSNVAELWKHHARIIHLILNNIEKFYIYSFHERFCHRMTAFSWRSFRRPWKNEFSLFVDQALCYVSDVPCTTYIYRTKSFTLIDHLKIARSAWWSWWIFAIIVMMIFRTAR